MKKILLTLAFTIAVLQPNLVTAKDRLAGYDDIKLAPFLWDWMDAVSFTEEGLKQIAAKKDPLRPFFLAFRLLVIHERTGDPEALAGARRALDYMISEYEPAERSKDGYRWFYGFDYDGGIKAPWWSGMDGFFGPMALYAGWEATGNEFYRELALKSARRMLKDPTKGGVLWREGDSCWISEYSWSGMSHDQEYYVLNGHLWGLQALFMLAEASGDKELLDAYQCARRGTALRLDRFLNGDATWSSYQLNPVVINPTHYNIIELAQFRALAGLTGDEMYSEPAIKRGELFRNAYPLQLVDTESGLEVRFSMMGAPSPYWTDTYPVTVRCEVNGARFEAQNRSVYDKKVPLSERLVLKLPVPSTPQRCDVAIHSNVEVAIYSETGLQVNSVDREPLSLDPEATQRAEAGETRGSFRIFGKSSLVNPATWGGDEARITIPIGVEMTVADTLALIVRPTRKVQLGTIIADNEGNTAFRYYPDLESGKDNIVVLNRLGFDRASDLNSSMKELVLRLYLTGIEDNFEVSVSSLEVLREPTHVQDWMREHEGAHFPQQ